MDSELSGVRTIVECGRAAEPWPYLKVGQNVRLDAGPLAGLAGILHEFKSRRRLIVSVNLLQRSVAVEIEGWWVAPTRIPSQSAGRDSASPATQARIG